MKIEMDDTSLFATFWICLAITILGIACFTANYYTTKNKAMMDAGYEETTVPGRQDFVLKKAK